MPIAETDIWPAQKPRTPLAVLCSGGVDSAVLLAEALQRYPAVYPIYVRVGSQWEVVEQAYLMRFLKAIRTPSLRPLTVLDQPVADLYGSHWSMSGDQVPDDNSPDEAVFLPGRNVLLLAKSLLWCHLNGVPEIAMAPLAANPFPDATPEFFQAFSASGEYGGRWKRERSATIREVLEDAGDPASQGDAAGAYFLVHSSCERPALRQVQQMRGTAKGLLRGRRQRSNEVRMFRVTREIHFCYGHRLLNYNGKCRHLHGHNGRVLIALEAEELDRLGMVIDFSQIKKIMQTWIDETLDHKMILHRDDPVLPELRKQNEPVVVIDVNPTAESIAKLIYDYAHSQNLPVVEVTLWETENSFATYRP